MVSISRSISGSVTPNQRSQAGRRQCPSRRAPRRSSARRPRRRGGACRAWPTSGPGGAPRSARGGDVGGRVALHRLRAERDGEGRRGHDLRLDADERPRDIAPGRWPRIPGCSSCRATRQAWTLAAGSDRTVDFVRTHAGLPGAAVVEQPPRGGERFRAGSVRRVQPRDVRLGAEPRRLALGERDVALRVELDRGLARERAVEDRPRLAVADRGERGQARVEPVAQCARLLDEPRVELLPRAAGDPLVMDVGREPQAEPGHGAAVADGRRGFGVAAQLRDLERPRDPARVGEVDPRREPRREGPEARDRRPEAVPAASPASMPARTAGSNGSASASRPRATARRYSPVPPARIATPPRPRSPGRTPRTCRTKSTTENGSSGSTRSSP